jgi:hypothetical protein
MTETRNYHREIVEERDRLRVERDELLKALKRTRVSLSVKLTPPSLMLRRANRDHRATRFRLRSRHRA